MPIDADRIHKPARKLRKILKNLPKRPSPDEIHDLRTNARRFEAVTDALGQNHGRKTRQLLRDLERLRKRAGKVRDMDVLIGYGSTANLEGEQDCLVQLIETLGANRTKYVKKLRVTAKKTRPGFRRRLKRTASDLQRTLDQAQEKPTDSAPDATAEATARAIEVSETLKNPMRLDKRNLHSYRLKVKELRYILQLANNADQLEFVKKLGDVKDAIGEWHDWEELVKIGNDLLDHGAKCKLLSKLQSTCERKYSEALSMTNHMRHVFLFKTTRVVRSRPGQSPRIRPRILASVAAICNLAGSHVPIQAFCACNHLTTNRDISMSIIETPKGSRNKFKYERKMRLIPFRQSPAHRTKFPIRFWLLAINYRRGWRPT